MKRAQTSCGEAYQEAEAAIKNRGAAVYLSSGNLSVPTIDNIPCGGACNTLPLIPDQRDPEGLGSEGADGRGLSTLQRLK